jgi:CelD/BcsL family acetyltransferase involved in cellulose biosynthesis
MQINLFFPAAGLSVPEAQIDAKRVSSLPAHTHLKLVSTAHALRALETDWRNLEQSQSRPASVFQSFDWVSTWCNVYLDPASETEMLIFAGYHNRKLAFVWPLMKTQRFGVSSIEWLTSPAGQYGDVLLAEGQNAKAWFESAINILKRMRGVDLLRLRHVRKDSVFHTFASEHLIDAKNPEKAPYLDLKPFQSEAAYEERYTPVQRKRRKKIKKKLEEFGAVAFEKLKPGPACDQAIETAVAEKSRWLQGRGRINRILNCPYHLDFLKRLSRNGSGDMELVVTELTTAGKPASWEIGFRHGKTHFAYITSHLEELTDLSVGRLHMDYSQKLALTEGQERFDLMVPYDAHKESWSSGMIDTDDFYAPLSVAGSVIGTLYLGFARPLIRKTYYGLSKNWLRRLHPLTKICL